MKTPFLTFFILFFLAGLDVFAVASEENGKDLRPEWLVVNDAGAFVPFNEASGEPEVIYFRLDARDLAGRSIILKDIRPFKWFINHQLAGSGNSFEVKVDSLGKAFSSHTLLVAIHRDDRQFRNLTTSLKGDTADNTTAGLVKREGSFFRDFVVLGIVALMSLVVVIVRLNPKLASDYFSFSGVFSTRESQDSQVYTRIGSSTNILFFAYCSMLLAYFLMIVFRFTTDEFPLANLFQGNYFWSVVLQWLKLSFYVLVLFFIKIILVFGISYLFGIPEIAGLHFFNWVRLLLIIFGILTIILFVYFTWHGQSVAVHSSFLKLLGWAMGGWIILIFLKLAGSAGASMFHLFSYICATELIPFLFIIRVLYK